MANGQAVRLYTSEILAQAVELARYPIDSYHSKTAEIRSRSCGSTLAIALETNTVGRVEAIGLQVSACAIGQASAAIFARSVKGKSVAEIGTMLETVERWLSGSGDTPDWPDIGLLDNARAYSGRREAILLPWRAAMAALSKVDARR